MPILYGDLLSNYRTVTLNGKRYLLDSWTEILQQDVSAKSFIQGDIADRIVEVSNPLHQGVMNGPILILRDSADVFKNTDPAFNAPFGITDSLDVILETINQAQLQNTNGGSNVYFLDSGTINIDYGECNATATITSTSPNGFGPNATPSLVASKLFGTANVIGRTARVWDFGLRLFGDFYPIQRCTINVKVNSEPKYAIGNNTTRGNTNANFAIIGYSITGEATITILPEQMEAFKLYQAPGQFNVFQNAIGLNILNQYRGNRFMNFGEFLVLPRISLNMNANQNITASVNFTTFVRRSILV